MNLADTRVVIRARAVPEIFDLSLHFVVELGSRLLLGLWLCLCLPGLLLCVWLHLRETPWFWVWLAALAWFGLVQGFFTKASSRLLFADDLRLGDVFTKWLRTLGAQLSVSFVYALSVTVSTLLLPLLPVALVRILYLPEIMLLEGFGVFAAFERAGRFTAGRFVAAFEVLCLLCGMLLWFVFLGEVLGRAVFVQLLSFPAPTDELLEDGGSVFALAGFFVSLPFVCATRFLAYVDGRTRREAWDVQVRFARIAARAGGAR